MNYQKFILIAFFLVILVNQVSAAHYIVGIVNDAKDGTSANGHRIILWNPLEGINENLTDFIGASGNSGTNNFYMVDCELLSSGCNISNTLSVKVINNLDGYTSYTSNVTITGAGFDVVKNITLNSPPSVFASYPLDNGNISNQEIFFNCSVDDLDLNLESVTLYGNWSGGWHANETKYTNGNDKYVTFTKILPQGVYSYGCKATDNLSISNDSNKNSTFTVDLTKPLISSILVNESYFCGTSKVIRVNCTANDEILGVEKVIIQAITQNYKINYTGNLLVGNTYYSDILINQTGTWNFNCIVNDSAGNENNLTTDEFKGYSSNPEIYINYQTILLSKNNPIENEEIVINATVENWGCASVDNLLISFFKEDPDLGGVSLGNDILNISQLSTQKTNISWITTIGKNNIFIFADYNNLINEDNETNNKANKTFSINSWQNIYGNITINKLIGTNSFNFSSWINESNITGNIFITDSECRVNWLTLQSISKKIDNTDSLNDFSEIDEVLGMEQFEDSISNVFSENQIPKETQDFFVQQKEISQVPIINSSEGYKFITGILWDYSDDNSLNNEYDSEDKEDLVFVGKVNQKTQGNYGVYDYEIKIPVKLREYESEESSEIYFYYDLN